jgi:Flp pilus assembly secretin CpaC
LLGSTNLDATFSPASGSPIATGATPAGIVTASFANGASPDLAVTNEGVNTLGVYIGQGDGTFASRIELSVPASPTALITSILSSSGLPDVALVAQGATPNQGDVAVILDSSAFSSTNGTSSSPQAPYPASEYVDIGVKIKATPMLHPNHEVTLQLEFEIRSLSGSNINGIPIISNRTLTQTVRVREDEPTLIGGLTDREETRTITGLPGFANLPGVGYAFGKHSKSFADTELLIVITPRRVRFPDHATHSIYAGRGGDRSPAIGGGPIPSERPNLPQTQPQPLPTPPAPAPPPNPQPNPPQPNPPPNPNP